MRTASPRGRASSSEKANFNSLLRMSGGGLTLFGRQLRNLRFQYSKRIFDLAQDLEVSSSSVSAWETGRRDISEAEIRKIGNIFNLSEGEIASLKEAAELSRNRVIIEPNSIEARQLANQMKKRINELTSEAIQTIMSHLKWTAEGRIRWDMRVAEKTNHEIELVAQTVRQVARTQASQAIDIVRFYEEHLDSTFFHFLGNELVENTAFEIWDDSDMPKKTRGMTTMFPPHIVISNSVYEDAAKGGHGGRWIMAHELGHLLLLHGIDRAPANSVNARGPEYFGPLVESVEKGLPFQQPRKVKKIPAGQSAEIQADNFAGELLMPREFCTGMLVHNIVLRYGVSESLAKKRLQIIGNRRASLH